MDSLEGFSPMDTSELITIQVMRLKKYSAPAPKLDKVGLLHHLPDDLGRVPYINLFTRARPLDTTTRLMATSSNMILLELLVRAQSKDVTLSLI
ncbi:hypothetical protein F5B20DRAFT_274756 [Whalleya microplaca]|nr:hypothetical protein F5B20DRAFT_274756 [Whalleya microplaca]